MAVLLAPAPALPASPSPPFTLRSAFWPNLHHFLYVVGRARNGARDAGRRAVAGAPQDGPDAALTAQERDTWEAAVAHYAQGLSARDAVFDGVLVGVTRELTAAADAPTLEGRALDAALREALERAAPVYRRAWWPRHDAANQARMAEWGALLQQHGAALRDAVSRAYGQAWPREGRTVEICAYANWAGAYSTKGPLLVMASLDPGTKGSVGLEMLFHEGMHQWDEPMEEAMGMAARRRQASVPPPLSHALVFYTAGELVRRQVPGHVPYAEAHGMWERSPMASCKEGLDRAWRPWLEGRGSLEGALDALLTPPGSPAPSPSAGRERPIGQDP